jgi:hypothetical protein
LLKSNQQKNHSNKSKKHMPFHPRVAIPVRPLHQHSKRETELQTVQRNPQPPPAPDTRTPHVFRAAVSQIPQHTPPANDPLDAEKEKHAKILRELNGSYFQDPQSPLKQAWDALVTKVSDTRLHHRSDLDALLEQTNECVDARSCINKYLLLETQRDTSEAILKKIISIQKNGPNASYITRSLEGQRNVLKGRQKQLCGNFYEDPASLLDIQWKAYQEALRVSSPEATSLFNAFQTLDTERKEIDSSLYFLDQQLSLAATSEEQPLPGLLAIQRQIDTLHGSPQEQELLAGTVNWRTTASTVHRVTLWNIASDLLPRY